MPESTKDIGKIIEDCINNPIIQYSIMREKNMSYKTKEKKEQEFSRAIGYCILFRSTDDIEKYMLISKEEEQIEFLKEKIVQILNIPKEEISSRNYEIFEYIYKNFNENGYVFHGSNSVSAEKVMTKGLGIPSSDEQKKELMHIALIYKKYGNDNPLGWGTLDIENNRQGWFYDGKPNNMMYYADSPEWFNQFCGGNHAYAFGLVPDECRNGYTNRDYETCKETITALIDKNKMSEEDKSEILNFFEKCWSKYGDSKPNLILIPLAEVDEIVPSEKVFEILSKDYFGIQSDPVEKILETVIAGKTSFAFNACSNKFISPEKLSCIDLTPILPRFKLERNQEEKMTLESCINILRGFNLKNLQEAQALLKNIQQKNGEINYE